MRICLTGPECTGKTTLSRRLAELLGAEWVPESSRAYVERVARTLTIDDVEPIAREHLTRLAQAETTAAERGVTTLVLDADLVSTVVYGAFYYGFTSAWLEAECVRNLADVYLLCDVDVPWVADGVRDQPTERPSMFELFRAALEQRGARFVIIRGDWDARWKQAREALGV